MLSKKRSRSISVENRNYQWAVTPSGNNTVFVAESADTPAGGIEVYLASGNQSGPVDFPDLDGSDHKEIRPKDAEKIIRQATKLGWKPTKKGKPLVFDYQGGQIIARKP